MAPETREIVRRLSVWLRPYRGRIFFLFLVMALNSASYTLLLYLLKPIFDGMFQEAADPEAAFRKLWTFTVPLAAAAGFLNFLTAYAKQYLLGYVGQKTAQHLRDELYGHVLRLPMEFFNKHKTGGLAARFTNDVVWVQNMVVQVLGNAASAALTVIAVTGLLFYLDWQLTIVALGVFPVGVYPIYRFGRKIRKATGEGQNRLEGLNGQIQETLGAVRVVKAFGAEEKEIRKFEQTDRDFYAVSMRSIRAQSLSSPLVEFIGVMSGLALFVWVAQRILIARTLSPGDMVAFIASVPKLYQQLKTFNGLWVYIQQGLAAADRCLTLLEEKEEETRQPEIQITPLRRVLELDRVGFAYSPGRFVLRDVSFKIRKGEVVALVGPSGSGKSTLADLLLKFYEPQEGRILWDGVDLSRVAATSVRRHIGLVSQETLLFHDTVLANVAYGKARVKLPEVVQACQAAYADAFIRELPNGYNTVIGDRGMRLSGGQRQRLAIARALLRKPSFLVLDEATSALDSESERMVQKALDRLLENQSALVIAHRLSTVQRADRIIVLHHGRIVEVGRHAVLLKRKGLYAKLYRMQFRNAKSSG